MQLVYKNQRPRLLGLFDQVFTINQTNVGSIKSSDDGDTFVMQRVINTTYYISVYMFVNGQWISESLVYDWALLSPQGSGGRFVWDTFGQTVAISPDGQTIAVGAPQAWVNSYPYGTKMGAVYVFERQPDNTWTSGPRLSEFPTASYFTIMLSESLDMSNDTIVAGSQQWGDGVNFGTYHSSQGTAIIFKRNDQGVWPSTGIQLFSPDPKVLTVERRFGRHVAIRPSDNKILIYSPELGKQAIDGTNETKHMGAVHVYEQNGNSWTKIDTMRLHASVTYNRYQDVPPNSILSDFRMNDVMTSFYEYYQYYDVGFQYNNGYRYIQGLNDTITANVNEWPEGVVPGGKPFHNNLYVTHTGTQIEIYEIDENFNFNLSEQVDSDYPAIEIGNNSLFINTGSSVKVIRRQLPPT